MQACGPRDPYLDVPVLIYQSICLFLSQSETFCREGLPIFLQPDLALQEVYAPHNALDEDLLLPLYPERGTKKASFLINTTEIHCFAQRPDHTECGTGTAFFPL